MIVIIETIHLDFYFPLIMSISVLLVNRNVVVISIHSKEDKALKVPS